MDKDEKLYNEFLSEAFFPRTTDVVIDTLISMMFAFLMIGIIVYFGFGYWFFLPLIFVVFFCNLTGSPRWRWFTARTSLHWNRVYKLRDEWEIEYRRMLDTIFGG